MHLQKFPDYTGGCFECSTYHIMAQSQSKEEMKKRRRGEGEEEEKGLHSILLTPDLLNHNFSTH